MIRISLAVTLVVALVVASAAAAKEPPTEPPVTIVETTVAQVGPCRVGVSNVWSDQGDAHPSLGASLSIMRSPAPYHDETVRVHEGQRVEIAGIWYVVEKITKGRGRGAVQLRRQ
jgi:hypothetical protein